MQPRIVDINEYMPIVTELIEQGETVSFTVTGESMSPFLRHGRDQVCLSAPAVPPVRGDIVLFRRTNGQYVLHRVLRRLKDGNYAIIGDGQQQIESPIAPSQILATVTQVCRKGKILTASSFWWHFFAGPWLTLLPLRPLLRRLARFVPNGVK